MLYLNPTKPKYIKEHPRITKDMRYCPALIKYCEKFVNHLVKAFPYTIKCAQTDNGTEFTNRFPAHRKNTFFQKHLEIHRISHSLTNLHIFTVLSFFHICHINKLCSVHFVEHIVHRFK